MIRTPVGSLYVVGKVGVGKTGVGKTTAAHFKHQAFTLTALCALAIGLAGCAGGGLNDQYDPASGASRKDYQDLVGRRGQDKVEKAQAQDAPPIPAFQSVLAAPTAPEMADTRRVSLSVTETTPVRDILIELARKAEVDLELDPRITGGVILSVSDRPFIDVIERIADLAELRFKFEKNVLRVELDDPYLEQYRMDVLNQTRQTSSSISSSSDASSASQSIGGGGGGGGNNKSESSVSTSSDSNFWKEIGKSVGEILNNIQSRRGAAGKDLQASFAPPSEAMMAEGDAKPTDDKKAGGLGVLKDAKALTQGRQAALDKITAEEAGDTEQQGAAKDSAGGAGAAGQGRGGQAVASSNYSVNSQAGIVTVFATKRQHASIEKYLRSVRNVVSQQVLIEAKVLEITLSDQFRTGINWKAFLGPNNDLALTGNFNRSVTAISGTPTVGVGWTSADKDLSIAAQLVRQFGTVRTLSSPRLTVLNNETAIIKVARNQVFFNLKVTTEEPTTARPSGKVSVTSDIKSVPVGLIMNVQPSVDFITKRISMSIRPSITRIAGFIEDPAVPVALSQIPAGSASGISSQIPIIDARELDSVVAMESGQTIVMGGLMQDTSDNQREGIPIGMDIPVLGSALSQNLRNSSVTELVVFIRATVVNDRDTIADEDIRLYKTFTPDPRPIAF